MCSIYHIFIPISHDMFVLFPLNHHSEWLNSNHRLDCNITEWTSFGPIIINHRVSYQFPLNHHFLKLQSPFWMLKSLKSEKNMLVSPFSHVFPMFFPFFTMEFPWTPRRRQVYGIVCTQVLATAAVAALCCGPLQPAVMALAMRPGELEKICRKWKGKWMKMGRFRMGLGWWKYGENWMW